MKQVFINYCINGIQFDGYHQLSPLTLTTLEMSSRSLMLDLEHAGTGTNPRAWYCYTLDPGGVVWQGPDGTNVPIGVPNNPNTAAVDDELILTGVSGVAIALHRGPTHFSPDGEHCCRRIANGPAQSRCVTFSEC